MLVSSSQSRHLKIMPIRPGMLQIRTNDRVTPGREGPPGVHKHGRHFVLSCVDDLKRANRKTPGCHS